MGLKEGEQFAELHHLVDVEDVLLERAGGRRIEPGQVCKTHLGDLRGRPKRELALEFEIIRDLLRTFPELIGDLDADRQFTLELVARVDADCHRPRFTPSPQRVLVVRGARVLGRNCLGRGDQIVFNRRIDALHERQAHETCQVDRFGRPRERKARFPDVHVELFLEALAHTVDGGLHRRFEITRKRRQKLLFDRSGLRPVLEADETDIRIDQFVAGPVDERNRFRLEPFDGECGEGGRLFDAKFLRLSPSARRRRKCGERQQEGKTVRGATHGDFSRMADCPRYIQDRRAAVFGTRARRDRVAAAPGIEDHVHKDWIGRSNIAALATADPAEREHSGRCRRNSSSRRAARTRHSRRDWAPRCSNHAPRKHPRARPTDIAYRGCVRCGRCGSIR